MIAFLYFLIEELFLKLGIYAHFWYKSIYTIFGLMLFFWFNRMWYEKVKDLVTKTIAFVSLFMVQYLLYRAGFIYIPEGLFFAVTS